MDTFKDKQILDDMYARGVAPWEVWKNDELGRPSRMLVSPEGLPGEPVA